MNAVNDKYKYKELFTELSEDLKLTELVTVMYNNKCYLILFGSDIDTDGPSTSVEDLLNDGCY